MSIEPIITVKELNAENWRAVAAVQVTEEQRAFVAEPSYYLALCAYGKTWYPLAVYLDDQVIGFLMWGVDPADNACWLGGILIVQVQQGKGYGRRAIQKTLTWLAKKHGFQHFALSYQPTNVVARHLYQALGFAETDEWEDDEVVARLRHSEEAISLLVEAQCTIRPLQSSDHAEWLRLREALWPDQSDAQNAQKLADILAHFDIGPAIVATRPDGGLCGFVEVALHESAPGCTTNKIGYLEGWYVDPDWRQRGVGRALVVAAEAWAQAQGCTEMASDIDQGYPLSPAAHTRLGYQEVGCDIYFRKELG